MASITFGAVNGNWSDDTKWVGGVKPTAADDALLTATSANVTVDGANVCKSLDCTTYTGTLTFNNAGQSLSIGNASGGAATFVAGMTVTYTAGLGIAFVSTSNNGGTGWGVTTGGKALPTLTFNGAGGKWVFQDDYISTTVGDVVLTAGTLDTNGKTINVRTVASNNSNTRTFTLGASSITLTGSASVWNFTTGTGLTFNCGTSNIFSTGTNASFVGGVQTFNNVTMSGGGAMNMGGTGIVTTFANLTITGKATKNESFIMFPNPTITGTFTLNANSATNRLLLQSSVAGTPHTITAAALVCTNVIDFMDITGAGGATWTTGASGATAFGDAGGNSGITFTTPATQTWSGTSGGNWSANAWTSRVPLPQDDVVISSAFSASQTVTFDMPRLGKNIDWTGTTGSPTVTTGTSTTLFGSLTLVAGVGTLSGGGSITFAGRSSFTITSAGHTITSSPIVTAPSGTYTLQDALSTTSLLSITIGTLTSNNFNVTALSFSVAGLGATYNAGTSTMTLTGTNGGIFTRTNSAAYNGGSDTVILTNASTTTRTFSVSAVSIGTLTYTVANSPGSLTLAGAGTFGTINVGSGRILTMPASTTVTFTNFNVNGTNNGYLYLPGVIGNYVTYNTSVLGSLSTIEYAVRVALDSYAGTLYLTGWDSTHSAILITPTRKLLTYVLNTGVVGIGNVASTSAFPDPGSGYIWLRSKLTISSALCEYWYSNDNTDTFASVSWTSLGTPTGANAGTTPLLTQSGNPVYGSISSGIAGAPGKYRQRVEIIDGVTRSTYNASAKAFGVNSSQDPQGNTWSVLGTLAQAGDGRVSLVSSTPTTQATVSKSSGVVSVDYLTIQDSAATGGAIWYAGSHSILVSNDTGWNFRAPPSGTPNLMMMGVG